LKIDRADLVTHDIGNMVGYAFAAQYPNRVTRFVLIDAPLPGVGPWEEICGAMRHLPRRECRGLIEARTSRKSSMR
jgi:pimeloyl-ACP methyl ester carboxylesterase